MNTRLRTLQRLQHIHKDQFQHFRGFIKCWGLHFPRGWDMGSCMWRSSQKLWPGRALVYFTGFPKIYPLAFAIMYCQCWTWVCLPVKLRCYPCPLHKYQLGCSALLSSHCFTPQRLKVFEWGNCGFNCTSLSEKMFIARLLQDWCGFFFRTDSKKKRSVAEPSFHVILGLPVVFCVVSEKAYSIKLCEESHI